ncbi:MAG: DUF2183 domain-containing protein [Bdellovibrio sp.]|nr:DUF2183 domain-containing protein [Bdellovibrio sp.]
MKVLQKMRAGDWFCSTLKIVRGHAPRHSFVRVLTQTLFTGIAAFVLGSTASAFAGDGDEGPILPTELPAAESAAAEIPFQNHFALVSDIDDTIKVTNVLDWTDLALRYLRGNTTFIGTPSLYQGLAKNSEKIAYLSGSPQGQKSNLVQLLFKNDKFPEGDLLLSNWWRPKPTPRFKAEELEKLALKYKNFILIGDDAEADPVTLTDFAKRHPEVQTRIYIHRIRMAALPDRATGYFVPLEVALNEYEAGSIEEQAVIDTAEDILKSSVWDRIFPPFKKCPDVTSYKISPGQKGSKSARLVELSQEVTAKIVAFCKGRVVP